MPPYSIAVFDLTTTSERLDVLDAGTRRITVFDITATSENVDELMAGARNVTVSDTTFTGEYMDILRGGARTVTVIDSTSTFDLIGLAVITNPALVIRTLDFSLPIPAILAFTVVKKDV